MKSMQESGKVALLCVAAVALILGINRLTGACPNEGASNSDHINSQCAYCLCMNGNWVYSFFMWNTNACSGTVYGANVVKDISCGNNWTFVFYPGGGTGPATATCNSAPYTGTCILGWCVGTMGPAGPLATHLLLQSGACTPGDCPG